MIKAVHDNGYAGVIRDDGALFIDNPDGLEVLTAKHTAARTEDSLMLILKDIPSFLEGIRKDARTK